MNRAIRALLGLGLAQPLVGCGHREDAPIPAIPACGDTWATFGEAYTRTWCTSCHSAGLPVELRYGAPLGVDFDSLDGVHEVLPAVISAATGDDPSMPPAGGPTEADVDRLWNWLACGAPGVATEPIPSCDGATDAGDVAIASAADAEALCASPAVRPTALAVSADASLGCVCEVSGALTVDGGTVDLPQLASVGGDLVVSGAAVALSAPSLAAVGGSVRAEDVASLVSLGLSGLASVGGDVSIARAPALGAVPLARLAVVGGSVTISQAPLAASVDLSRLATVPGDVVLEDVGMEVLLGQGYALDTVGGDLVLRRLPSWIGMYGFATLRTIGGDLRIEDDPSLDRIRGFTALTSIGGTLSVSRDTNLELLDGFDNLVSVGGDVAVQSNPSLVGENAFARIITVDGAVRVTDNPALRALQGLALPHTVGGLVFERNGAIVEILGFGALTGITGDLSITGMPGLTRIDGFGALASVDGDVSLVDLPALVALDIGSDAFRDVGGDVRLEGLGLTALTTPATWRTVGGDLALVDNLDLTDVSTLQGLDQVGNDVAITGNHALPSAAANALAAAIEVVGGTVTIADNGP